MVSSTVYFYRALAGLVLISPLSLSAQTSVCNIPQGYVTVSIPAGSASAPSVATFSLPTNLTPPSDFQGKAAGFVTSVTSNTLTCDAANWEPGALSNPASPYFIRITSGAATGHTFQISTSAKNTATVVTVIPQGLDLTTLGITNGTTYKIFPGDTLNSFFGTSTLGGSSAATADNVLVFSEGTWNIFHYHTPAGQWRSGALPVNRNNVVLRPDAGITFYRRGNTPLQYVLQGEVPSTELKIVVNNNGPTYIGGVFPVDQTLAELNLQSFPGWQGSSETLSEASTVSLWDGLSWVDYNYTQANGHWRAGALPINRNNASVPAGTPLILTQPGMALGVSVLNRPLPYPVN